MGQKTTTPGKNATKTKAIAEVVVREGSLSRFRSRLVIGILLEQRGISADNVSAKELLQAEHAADALMRNGGKPLTQ